jgi:hypothetical protein
MKFDKSKVCVAGLHEVKEGTKGWFAKNIKRLCDRVERNDCMSIVRSTTAEGFECFEGDLFPFFYHAPEKTYRPFETIDEARVLNGKWIRSKDRKKLIMITAIYIGAEDNELYIKGHRSAYISENFVMDETGEPVGVEV